MLILLAVLLSTAPPLPPIELHRQATRAFYGAGGAPADPARAAALFEQACEGGHAPACHRAGDQHYLGEGVSRDVARAARFYLAGCELGLDEACYRARRLYRWLAKDPVAGPLYVASVVRRDLRCEGGDLRECVSVAFDRERGTTMPADPAGAETLFEKTCARGHVRSCFEHAKRLARRGAPSAKKVLGDATTRGTAACARGSCEACGHLYNVFQYGDGGPKDKPAAAKVAKQAAAACTKACATGSVEGCTELDLLERLGLAPDKAGWEGLTALCAKADVAACTRAKLSHPHARRDCDAGARAECEDDVRACDLGAEQRCYNLGSSLRHGHSGRAKDPVRSTRFFRLACHGGHSSACEELVQVCAATKSPWCDLAP